MSQRQAKTVYWQDAPQPREQLLILPESLEARIPEDHPVRLLDEIILDGLARLGTNSRPQHVERVPPCSSGNGLPSGGAV